MKHRLLSICKILFPPVLIPLWFANIFRGVGHLPNPDGSVSKVSFYHSMAENLSDSDLALLMPLSIALILASVFLSIARLFRPGRRFFRLDTVLHILSLVLFLICLAAASAVGRGY